MKPNLVDGIPMQGTLTIVVKNAVTGKIKTRIEIRNKITFLAADVLVELLAQRATDPIPGQNSIFSMRMGTSSTAATRADTNLGAFVIGKQLADVDKITGLPGELEFSATLLAGDANGLTLREAGLFTKGGAGTPTPSDAPGTAPGTPRMFARQIHPAIVKSISITAEYNWRIAFTV